jgi:hypothetical protein
MRNGLPFTATFMFLVRFHRLRNFNFMRKGTLLRTRQRRREFDVKEGRHHDDVRRLSR